MFLTKRLERCLCRSDFGKGTWITLGLEAVFSRNMRKNTCSLVGGLISFDYSSQEGRRTSYPKLIWGMSFKTILSKAVEWGYLLGSPAIGVKKFKVESRRLVFLDKDEIEAFLQASKITLRPIFATLIWTGMRKSECFNLVWDDIDLENRLIFLTNTKNSKPREIPINDDIFKVLNRIPRHISSPYVFSQESGKPWKDLRGSISSTANRAGIKKHITHHTFRHTFASHLVMSGVDLLTVMELLGHSSLDMVQRYAHLSPHHKRQAMGKLQAHFRATNEPPEAEGSGNVPLSR